jgi:hypothetical protein
VPGYRDPVPSGALRVPQCTVGPVERHPRLDRLVELGHAAGDGDGRDRPVLCGDLHPYPFRQRPSLTVGRVGQHHELLAAVAEREARGRGGGPYSRRCALQDGVAHVVSVGRVDLAEEIEVEHEHGERLRGGARTRAVAQLTPERALVPQARQGVDQAFLR